jgi:hypothetical protein
MPTMSHRCNLYFDFRSNLQPVLSVLLLGRDVDLPKNVPLRFMIHVLTLRV